MKNKQTLLFNQSQNSQMLVIFSQSHIIFQVVTVCRVRQQQQKISESLYYFSFTVIMHLNLLLLLIACCYYCLNSFMSQMNQIKKHFRLFATVYYHTPQYQIVVLKLLFYLNEMVILFTLVIQVDTLLMPPKKNL